MYPIYILGVKTNYRGKPLVEQLNIYGIDPIIVWGPEVGLDTKLIQDNTDQDFARFTIQRSIKPQEVACCLGHVRMYTLFQESQEEWALFLEDDSICLIDPTQFLLELPKVENPTQIFIHDGPGTNLDLRLDKKKMLNLDVVRRLDPQYGAYGYILNKAAVNEIVNSQVTTKINTPDWPYCWPRRIEFYTSKKVYFSHPEETAYSIIGERINKAPKLHNQIPNPIRIVRGRKFNLSLAHLLSKELNQKFHRIILQIRRKVFK